MYYFAQWAESIVFTKKLHVRVLCWTLKPRGGRSETPKRSMCRLLWLWVETVPAPCSFVGEVQTDSRLMLSGTSAEATSIFDWRGQKNRCALCWGHSFWPRKERDSQILDAFIRDCCIPWHACVCVCLMSEHARGVAWFKRKRGVDITVHRKQLCTWQRAAEGSLMLRTRDFRVYGDAWTQFMSLHCDCGHMGGKQWEDTRLTHTHTCTHTYTEKQNDFWLHKYPDFSDDTVLWGSSWMP